jgi:hypothetical protein
MGYKIIFDPELKLKPNTHMCALAGHLSASPSQTTGTVNFEEGGTLCSDSEARSSNLSSSVIWGRLDCVLSITLILMVFSYLNTDHCTKCKTPFDLTGWQDHVLEVCHVFFSSVPS